MILNELIQRVRKYTRDTTGSLFTQEDIFDFCNEGIERMKQIIVEFKDVPLLKNNSDEVLIIPEAYHHLIAVYSASRCFSQDEQQYQASTFMNEFENKMDELLQKISSGDIKIKDINGEVIKINKEDVEGVVNVYFSESVGV